ncbi:MAG TPA: hypothetical protein VMS22_23885 [Candidatus Eisenbacteria bacterium]|nr:hypothetical protein [Candidatus Eisenbacteria bacterium]
MMRRWVILNGILAVIVLGLAFMIARTWARTLPPVEVAAGGKAADVPVRSGDGSKKSKRGAAEKTVQTPAMLVTAIVNKDLFDPTRTKQSEEAKIQAPVPHEAPPTGVTLAGIRILGKDREAIITEATSANAQRRIRNGDPVGNFTVKTIGRSSVLLVSAAGDEFTLTLEVDKAKTPGGAAAPARPRPGGVAPAASGSPAAGITGGAPTSAGTGSAGPGGPRPGLTPAAATAVTTTTSLPGMAGVPPFPVATTLMPGGGLGRGGQVPQLPAGVREKIEQMKKDRQK